MGMEPDEAKDRTKQQGKDPSGEKDKKSPFYDDPNFITRATLSEIQKQKAIKVLEDMLTKKQDSGSNDVGKKTNPKELDNVSPVIKKNMKSLIKQAEKHGLSKKDLIKLIQGE
jgi:hypothetical protein